MEEFCQMHRLPEQPSSDPGTGVGNYPVGVVVNWNTVWRKAFCETEEAVLLIDTETDLFLDANPPAEKLTGWSARDLRSMKFGVLFAAKGKNDGQRCMRGRTEILSRAGTRIPIEFSCFAAKTIAPNVLVCLVRDLTEQELLEQERKATIRLLHLVNVSRDADDLLRKTVHFVRSFSGCDAVGARLKEGPDYPFAEADGFPDTFCAGCKSLAEHDSEAAPLHDEAGNPVLQCFCGAAIRGKPFAIESAGTPRGGVWINNLSQLLGSAGKRPEIGQVRFCCRDAGFESIALLPLRAGKECLGLLHLATHAPGFFSLRTIELWQRLADYMATALAKFLHERAVEESEERFRSLVEMAPDAIFVHQDDEFLYANPATIRIIGAKSFEELARHGVMEFISPDLRLSVMEWIQKSMGGEPQPAHELKVIALDGRELIAEAVIAQILFQGKPALLSIMCDITQYKQTKAELEQSGRRKDEFLATLAHELRNPLVPIRNAAYLLSLRAENDAELNGISETIERQVEHMARLIDDLLDISRIDHGKIVLKKERTDLRTIIERAVEICTPVIDGHGHHLTVALPGEPLEIEGDQLRIEQIVCNLITNACKYTHPGGDIHIGAAMEKKDAVCRIRDNGIGMKAATVEKVFDLFFQEDQSMDRMQGGLGIGLTLVDRLVKLHAGSVTAASDGLGKGSEFTLRIPVAEQASALPIKPRSTIAAPAEPKAFRHVLVVDDNELIRFGYEKILERAGFKVSIAADGETAVKQAIEFRPDAAIIDLGLPGLNGLEVASGIRAALGGNMFLIALTGYSQLRDRMLTAQAGFDHHLVKPVNPKVLIDLLSVGKKETLRA